MTEWKIDDYDTAEGEQQIADTETKAILLALHAELQSIRILLSRSQAAEGISQQNMRCSTCGEQNSTEAGMRRHAQRAHNAPTDIALDELIKS